MSVSDQNLSSEGSSSAIGEASAKAESKTPQRDSMTGAISSTTGPDVASQLRDAERRLLEMADRAASRMETRLAEIEAATVSRIEQDTAEMASGVREVLRRSIQQQLPPLEKEVLERCRVVSERMLAAQVEQWTLLFSDRLQKAQQTIRESLETAEAEAATHRDENLAGRSEQLLQECTARLEQQMDRVGIRVRQSFLRQVGAELTRSQRHWLEQAQRQLEHVAEQNLQRTRRNVSEMLRQIGETLLRQSYIEDNSPDRVRAALTSEVTAALEPSPATPAGVEPPSS